MFLASSELASSDMFFLVPRIAGRFKAEPAILGQSAAQL